MDSKSLSSSPMGSAAPSHGRPSSLETKPITNREKSLDGRSPPPPASDGTPAPLFDDDAMKLATMGYTQEMTRKFSIWSLLGVGFSLTNSWFGISAALVTGIDSGGPLLLIYGIPVIAIVSTCVAISLAELASALPNAGGQYFWASELAPPRYAGFASYLTGWFAWTGSLFTSASVAAALGSALCGCWQLSHPDFVIKSWHVFVAYQVVNFFCYLWNCWGRGLPYIAKATLFISLTSFLVIIVTVPARAETHQSAKFVFATFINNTGWRQDGMAWIVGLVNANWAFACLDSATHMAEEIPRPERNIPTAMLATVAMGFTTAWFYCIAMFFSMSDFASLVETSTGVPILALYHQALDSVAGAIALESLLITTGFGCMIASHTWQSRLCWSFARDAGLPGHRWLARVHPRLDMPWIAHTASCIVVAIIGCLYLASQTAFNSMATACIVLLYVSYAIPIIALLVKGRGNIPHGPFWLGPFGLAANCVLLAWTVFTIVMYSLPYTRPVWAGNMNYVSVVYAVIVAIILGDWFLRGKRSYRGQRKRHEEAEEVVARSRQASLAYVPSGTV